MVSVIAFALVFSVVVIIHEFGHFIAARKAGVKVYEFSIGFPLSPRLLTLFRHKETEFTLRLLPLGGFVSFSKQGGEEAKELFHSSLFKRAAIVSAGPLSNMVFGLLILSAVLYFAKHLSPGDAFLSSAGMLGKILAGTFGLIFQIISGNGSMEGLAGPVGIAAMAGQAAERGFFALMYFTGILSMSIGIINLFPLPALDGGHLSIIVIEAARRKPLTARTYQVVTVLGISLFLIITAVVTYKDIMGLVA